MHETEATTVASYHLSAKVVSRSTGRSATAAAAYRAAARVRDARTGELHDFVRKRGVVHCETVTLDSARLGSGTTVGIESARHRELAPMLNASISTLDGRVATSVRRFRRGLAQRVAEVRIVMWTLDTVLAPAER